MKDQGKSIQVSETACGGFLNGKSLRMKNRKEGQSDWAMSEEGVVHDGVEMKLRRSDLILNVTGYNLRVLSKGNYISHIFLNYQYDNLIENGFRGAK